MDQNIKVLTCNIRNFGAADGQNSWIHRQGICIEVIRSKAPDIICFQEMWSQQFADLSTAFPEYSCYGMVDEPAGGHRPNCIFYRADKFTLISAGGYWLSEYPHVAGSKSWDSECVRLANWVRLGDRATYKEFRVVNTHLDHVSQAARENQARLIVEDASSYPEIYPQILTGDMNCDFTNRAIKQFRVGNWMDTYDYLHGTEDPGHTFHAFLGPKFESTVGKMDWIFMRGRMKAAEAEIVTDSINGRYPSDHYFVSATVNL